MFWFWFIIPLPFVSGCITKMFINDILLSFIFFLQVVSYYLTYIYVICFFFTTITYLKFISINTCGNNLLVFQCCMVFHYVRNLDLFVYLLVDSTFISFCFFHAAISHAMSTLIQCLGTEHEENREIHFSLLKITFCCREIW